MQAYETDMLMLKGECPKHLHLVMLPLFSFELTFFSIHFQWPLIRNHLVIFFLKCFLKICCSVGFCCRLVPQVADYETEICVQKTYWALLLRIDLVWDERKGGDGLKKNKQDWVKGKVGLWNITESSTDPRRSSWAEMPLQNFPKLGQGSRHHQCGLQQGRGMMLCTVGGSHQQDNIGEVGGEDISCNLWATSNPSSRGNARFRPERGDREGRNLGSTQGNPKPSPRSHFSYEILEHLKI